MDTKTIYYVAEISGEYEDYRSIPIMAFPTKEAAEEFARYKRDLESTRQRINKKVYRLMDKEKKKYKDGHVSSFADSDDFYQHYDEILDKIYDQLVVNGTIDPNKHKRESIYGTVYFYIGPAVPSRVPRVLCREVSGHYECNFVRPGRR